VFNCKTQNKSCPELDVVDRCIVKVQEKSCDEILTEILIPVEDKKGREKSKVACRRFFNCWRKQTLTQRERVNRI
jgi:intergrase/recombinase